MYMYMYNCCIHVLVYLQDTFKVTPSKSTTSFRPGSTVFRASERYVFLFQRLLLITKKKDDGFHYRKHIEVTWYEEIAEHKEGRPEWERDGGGEGGREERDTEVITINFVLAHIQFCLFLCCC